MDRASPLQLLPFQIRRQLESYYYWLSPLSSLKHTKRNAIFDVGSTVQGEVTEIKPLELTLKFGSGLHGMVHITEAANDNNGLRIWQTVTARIVLNCTRNRNYQWELSLKPSLLSGSCELEEGLRVDDYEIGASVSGFVYKMDKEWAWATVSWDVNAQLYILDSACELAELEDFQKQFYVGKFLSGYVMKVDKEIKLLRLVLRPRPLPVSTVKNISLTNGTSSLTNHLIENKACHIIEGSIVGGKKGQCWLSGDALQSTEKVEEEVASKIDSEVNEVQKMLQLAAAQRMNTDARRAIFCVIMSAEDFGDAFTELLGLDLQVKQKKESAPTGD